MHIPEPHRHVTRHYGTSSSVIRARRQRQAPARADAQQPRTTPPTTAPVDPERRALHRRWAELIKRIYEVNSLACPRCGPPCESSPSLPSPASSRRSSAISRPRPPTNAARHTMTAQPLDRRPLTPTVLPWRSRARQASRARLRRHICHSYLRPSPAARPCPHSRTPQWRLTTP